MRATDLFANGSLSSTQFLPICIGFLFVLFIAERMSEFMGDGQVKKVIHSRRPLPDELYAPRRDGAYQRFFKKRLPPIENAKRRAFGVHSVLVLERIPVVRLDQHPRPASESDSSVFVQQRPEHAHLLVASLERVSDIADEMLRTCLRGTLFGRMSEGYSLRKCEMKSTGQNEGEKAEFEAGMHWGTSMGAPQSFRFLLLLR